MSANPSGHNIGELLRSGVILTTREALALTHEVCRDTSATFPQSPDDLWITDTGELLIARSDQVAQSIDPRNGVASLLEAMLPPDGSEDPRYVVPKALRGLPTRLRVIAADVGPQDRKDLMSILSWHLDGDPREVIEQLVVRVSGKDADAVDEPAAGADGDLDLFSDPTEPAEASSGPPQSRVRRVVTVLALFAIGLLFIAIGSASYWLFRFEPYV